MSNEIPPEVLYGMMLATGWQPKKSSHCSCGAEALAPGSVLALGAPATPDIHSETRCHRPDPAEWAVLVASIKTRIR